MSKGGKARYWAFVGYPESLPSDWIDFLIFKGLSFAVSPLHDKDIDPDGNLKKPHYHILLCWNGPTTFQAASSITEYLNSPIPIALVSPKGYYRYFIHKDNPDKFQYDENEIRCFNGFDISEYFSSGDVQDAINMLSDLIIDSNISEYSVFCDIVRSTYPQYRNVAFSHTIHFNALIRSVRHRGGTTTPPYECHVPDDNSLS